MGGGISEWQVNTVHTVEVLITTLIIVRTPGAVRSTERTFTAPTAAVRRILSNSARKSGAVTTTDTTIPKVIT